MSGFISRVTVAVSALCLMLAACGGGADTGTPTVADLAQAQGIWEGTGSSGLTASAVVLPEGAVWLVLAQNDQPVALVQGRLVAQGTVFAGSAGRYVFSPPAKTLVSLNADARAQASLSLRYASTDASDALQMTYQTRYESTLSVADLAGPWRGLTGDGVVAIEWTLNPSGAIEGRSSTGCTYSGAVSVRPQARAVLNARVTEICAGASASFDGVVTLSADQLRAHFAFVSADSSSALLIGLRRQ